MHNSESQRNQETSKGPWWEGEREGTIERRMLGAIKGEREKWVGLTQYRAESIGVQEGKAKQGRRINNSKTVWKDHQGTLLCCKLP